MSKVDKIDIDMKNVDPELLKLAKRLAKDMNNKGGGKDEKTICPAAVRCQTNAQVNKKIGDGTQVYSVPSKEKKDKTEYFYRCTRPASEGIDLCWKHNQTFLDTPDHLHRFEDEVVKNSDARLLSKTDILTVKKNKSRTTTDSNPNPIISIIVTEELKQKIADLIQHQIIASEPEDDEQEQQASDDQVSDGQVSDDQVSEGQVSDDQVTDSDGCDAKEFETKDGRKLHLDIASNTVYQLDEDDVGENIGTLMPVSEELAPIYFKDLNSNCIVGIEYEEKGVKYTRCSVSNQLYKEQSQKLVKVGRVDKAKNGSFKIVLQKVKKV